METRREAAGSTKVRPGETTTYQVVCERLSAIKLARLPGSSSTGAPTPVPVGQKREQCVESARSREIGVAANIRRLGREPAFVKFASRPEAASHCNTLDGCFKLTADFRNFRSKSDAEANAVKAISKIYRCFELSRGFLSIQLLKALRG